LLYRNTFQNHCQDKNDGISVKYFSHFSLADKQTGYIFTNSSLTNNYEYLYLDAMWISLKEINIKRPILFAFGDRKRWQKMYIIF